MIIALDCDSVIIDLMTPWLNAYNKDFNDNLTINKITDWNLDQFVRPECGKYIYNYLKDRSLYDNAQPIIGALKGIQRIREMNHRIVYATTSTPEQSGRKYLWLFEHGLITSMNDYIEITDKNLIDADLLLDDRYENAKSFYKSNSQLRGFLFTQPWNKKYNYALRIDDWETFVYVVEKISGI